jgi:hypothetical protein
MRAGELELLHFLSPLVGSALRESIRGVPVMVQTGVQGAGLDKFERRVPNGFGTSQNITYDTQ